MDSLLSVEDSHVDVLHEITVRLNAADGFHEVLSRVVDFATALVKCDSCLVYVLEGDEYWTYFSGWRPKIMLRPPPYSRFRS